MKKLLIFLVMFFSFLSVTYADPLYCYVEKDANDNMVLKSNDVITIYFKSSHEYRITSAKYQLYYDPYVLEIVKDEDNYIYQDGNINIINVKKHSSLIEFEIDNKSLESETLPNIYVKFKVKENAKNGSTTLELIGDNSYVIKSEHMGSQTEDGEETYEDVKESCANSILKYTIDNDNNSSDKTYDSLLSSMDISSDLGFISPSFSPDTFDYTVYLNKGDVHLYIRTICAVNGCYDEEYEEKNTDMGKTVSFETNNNGSKSKYNLTFELINNEDEYEYPILTKLKILKYNMTEDFDSDRYTYHVVVPDTENSLLIDYESKYDVKIIGNENFKIGENIVVISVENKNDVNKYYIVVQKQEKEVIEDTNVEVPSKDREQPTTTKDNTVANITLGLILLLTLGVLTIFIFGGQKKKE